MIHICEDRFASNGWPGSWRLFLPYYYEQPPISEMVLPMNQYPVEVIQRIVDATSQADRLSWRAADKAYCGLITPKAFKDIRIENSVMGVEKLNALIRSANLRIYINSLTYGKVDGAHEVEGPSNVDGVRYGTLSINTGHFSFSYVTIQ